MNKIWLIVKREFMSRIRKKSFLLMTVLGPFLFAIGMVVPLWMGGIGEESRVIEVMDNTGLFQYKMPEIPGIRFAYFNGRIEQQQKTFMLSNHEALLYIPANALETPDSIVLYSQTTVAPQVKYYLEEILGQMMSLEKIRLKGIDPEMMKYLDTDFRIHEKDITHGARKRLEHMTASTVVSLFSAVMILFFIVLYGGQVMRGVIEEKTNRIIEVMISSVKPFQLMMGKIGGIALVSIVQFGLWISVTFGLTYLIKQRYGDVMDNFSDEKIAATIKNNPGLNIRDAFEINELMNAIGSIDFSYILLVFVFYFIVGYLLYGALFAAIGSVVDSETDTQQFVFPLIAPLMFCMIMATSILGNPFSNLAWWLSMIPFTSPVAMMLRLPFGVPLSDLLLSMGILLFSFILFTGIASRIYRMGILMYGKKAGFREIFKWIRY